MYINKCIINDYSSIFPHIQFPIKQLAASVLKLLFRFDDPKLTQKNCDTVILVPTLLLK